MSVLSVPAIDSIQVTPRTRARRAATLLLLAVLLVGFGVFARDARSAPARAIKADGKVICYSGVILGQPTGDICVPYPLG